MGKFKIGDIAHPYWNGTGTGEVVGFDGCFIKVKFKTNILLLFPSEIELDPMLSRHNKINKILENE
jgi:hypothetical protein